MKTKTLTLYDYSELSKEAKEVALRKWRENNEYLFLDDFMAHKLHELLEENGIKDKNDTSKAGTRPTPVYYSLSYCQGDGAMFQGSFKWNGYNVDIKHRGHYYHSYSADVEITDEEGNEPETGEPLKAFELIYQNICGELEDFGYSTMREEDSEERFIEVCELNEWTFRENGLLENL